MEHVMQDICVLCCQTITIYAVGACNHPVCYECSARMRALCHQNECAVCREDLQKVVLTQKLQPFNILNQIRFPLDRDYRVYFEDVVCQKMYYSLFENTCKLCSDKQVFISYWCLRRHMNQIHKLFYCDLCGENLRLFTLERKYYTRELDRHESVGDLDDTSHRGHPLCDVCDRRYLDQDELYRHLHREHFFCHFCGDCRFYRNYNQLRSHFRRMHYLCEDGQCRNERFNSVFRNEIELKDHRDLQHKMGLDIEEGQATCALDSEFGTIADDKQYEKHHGPIYELGRREENWERNSYNNNSNLWDGCLEIKSPINIESMEKFPCLLPSIPLKRTTKSIIMDTKINSVTESFPTRMKYENNFSINIDDFPVLGQNVSCVSSQSSSSKSSLDFQSQTKISLSNKNKISKNDRSTFEKSIKLNAILTSFFSKEDFTGASPTSQKKANCHIASQLGNENGYGSNENFNKHCQTVRRNKCKSKRRKQIVTDEIKSNTEEMICSKSSVSVTENSSLSLQNVANSIFNTEKTKTNSHPDFQNMTVGIPVRKPSPTFVYAEPPNFKRRNDILIGKIYSYLDRDYWALTEFKSLSDCLLKSSVSAKDYCTKCNGILGYTGFLKFIPEILVLLPNIHKQQDLFSEVRKYFARESESTGATAKGTKRKQMELNFEFEVCVTCSQVLSKDDFGHHKSKAH